MDKVLRMQKALQIMGRRLTEEQLQDIVLQALRYMPPSSSERDVQSDIDQVHELLLQAAPAKVV
jgi:hypothetical protein